MGFFCVCIVAGHGGRGGREHSLSRLGRLVCSILVFGEVDGDEEGDEKLEHEFIEELSAALGVEM